VVGRQWSKDPEGNPGGNVTNGRVSNVGQVKGDDLEEKGYSGPSGWGGWAWDHQPNAVKVNVETTSMTPQMMEAPCK
jgi:hypothetical protein